MTMTENERQNVDYGPGQEAQENEILRTVVGSGVHGLAIEGTDDHDEMGIFIEPRRYVVGIKAWNYTDNIEGIGPHGADRHISRTQPEGARSGPGDTDLVLYSLRKYLRLAAKGNPTALLPLFAPEESVLKITDLGRELRTIRTAFLSTQAVERFIGYMDSQHERMLGYGKRNRVPNRPELVEAHGYDTKYASHALRLALEGYEIATMGRLTLPLREEHRDLCLQVKQGEWPIETVSQMIESYRRMTLDAIQQGRVVLPPEPLWKVINSFSERAHLRHWGLAEGV